MINKEIIVVSSDNKRHLRGIWMGVLAGLVVVLILFFILKGLSTPGNRQTMTTAPTAETVPATQISTE